MMARLALTFPIALSILAACGRDSLAPQPRIAERPSTLTQTCTAQNIAGYPYSGTLCAGWAIDGCTPGMLYNCTGGPRGTQNNCTLKQTCNPGCLSGPNSTPVTVNTQTPVANDACFGGATPLTLSSSSVTGGSNITLTATLQATHTPYAIVNLQQLGLSIAQPCNVPLELPSTSTTMAVVLPTAVVTSQQQAAPWVLTNYNDSNGHNRNLVGLPQPLAINPGGSIVIPPLASFTITDANGNPVTTLAGGASAYTSGSLTDVAPFGGVNVSVTGSPAGQITGGSFTIGAGCTSLPAPATTFGGALTATTSDTSSVNVTVSANSGAGASISHNITVGPAPLAIGNVILNPNAVTGGNSSQVTVTLNRAVSSSDPTATVSVRVSEGLVSGTQIATFPGCTGSPACTGTITVPLGASSASLTLTTSSVGSQDFVTVAASAPWSNSSASANLTINPGTCTPKTCSQLGFSCGSASDGCGGTLSCGTCASGQTCTNNVCVTSTCTPATCSSLGFNCGGASDGCGGTLSCGTCGGGQTCTNNVCVNAPSLSSLALNPTSVRGGNSSTGTVTLNGAAPSGGAAVALSSSNTSVARVPSSVTIAAGASSASFTVTTQRVNSSTTVTISGSYGVSRSATLTVTGR